MGIGGMSIWQLLIILAIIVLLFGTKKLKGIGGDLGGAVKGFKKALSDDKSDDEKKTDELENKENTTLNDSVEEKEKSSNK